MLEPPESAALQQARKDAFERAHNSAEYDANHRAQLDVAIAMRRWRKTPEGKAAVHAYKQALLHLQTARDQYCASEIAAANTAKHQYDTLCNEAYKPVHDLLEKEGHNAFWEAARKARLERESRGT